MFKMFLNFCFFLQIQESSANNVEVSQRERNHNGSGGRVNDIGDSKDDSKEEVANPEEQKKATPVK